MTAEYRFHAAPTRALLAILIPGLAVGLYLAVTGYELAGFIVSTLFAFGTLPVGRFLGLAEVHFCQAGSEALTITVSAPLTPVRETAIPWERITALNVDRPVADEPAIARLTVKYEGGKPLLINGAYPGFSDWLPVAQQRFEKAHRSNRVN